ncbi:Nucleotide sugar dehydrogenase [Metarhizium album ARSEF 1941]|uniref:Nucleotide sugar dehydrogenase n=1 Tax=Metarhizium album (strain ARSEF 1941) TaxID=1081103 RepID=A0A0B2WYI6_METAS|nr:Nucleotide sugar dehydrogenase [Metarhizium album ARSEF 1941]KHO01322.1 Nucleotide sugar dehydrogenase [Metarhizium album ARSEF 1941]
MPTPISITPPNEGLLGCSQSTDVWLRRHAKASPRADIVVAVVGVGYVGKRLVQSFSARFKVIAYDISSEMLRAARRELSGRDIAYTTCPMDMKQATHFLIAVPTLANPDTSIDTSHISHVIRTVATVAQQGSTIVIESSVAVGMTRHLLAPIAASHGLFAGMSPERVDPGRANPTCADTPKIISGLEDTAPGSLAAIKLAYEPVFSRLVPVSSPEVAEMTKLYENCQRMMCIAFVNEMADAALSHGIDPFEVSKAAATKPFGYAPYSPSVGVGGHCIPVNPYYLLSNGSFPLLQAATETMAARPARIAKRATEDFKRSPANVSGRRSRVLVVGVGFKAGQSMLNHSPGVALLDALHEQGQVDVSFADPLVRQEQLPHVARLDETEWDQPMLETFDIIIVCVKQPGLDYQLLHQLYDVRVENWCE